MKILILDQGRQSLPFFKSLRKNGHYVISIYSSRLSEAYFSRYPSKKIRWESPMKNPSAFYEQLIRFIAKDRVDLIIGVSDFSAEILSKHKSEISKYSKILIPDFDIFSYVVDKYTLMKHCMKIGIPCPITYDISEVNELIQYKENLKFPIMVKPKRGIGSVGVFRYDSFDELYTDYDMLREKFGELFIQEFITQKGGSQFQAELFMDERSNVEACVVIAKPRFFPVSGGTSTANVSIKNKQIEDLSTRLLKSVNWIGAADIDFIFDPIDKQHKVLEINPRVTAGIKIAFEAGVDFANLYVDFAKSRLSTHKEKYKLDVYSRLLILDLLWYIYSGKGARKNTSPSFFNFFGKNVIEQTFSKDDPLPFFGFILAMFKKYLNISRFKDKFLK